MSAPFQQQLDELIRARYTLLYVLTWEEDRARRLISQIAQHQQKPLYEWSVTEGLRRVSGGRDEPGNGKRQRELLAALNEILQAEGPAIYLLKDLHPYLDAPEIIRQLRDLAYALRQTHKNIIILSPVLKIPAELDKLTTLVDLPLPTFDELNDMLNMKIGNPRHSRRFQINLSASERDAMVKAAQGLTLLEAENAFAKAIVRDEVLDASDIEVVLQEKVQVIRKSNLLEYYAAEEHLDNIGGMDLLKDWLKKRGRAFSKEARDYGLPEPKGILLLGVQGCGKSLIAKSVAATWRMPLLRMDMSRIFQGYIGSSEDNMRRALAVAETIAPVVLWIDEIEKACGGVEGSHGTDGGTTARVVGQLLTWMQEKKAPVFVAATANAIAGLPPELFRKGRLDDVFFVDLPRSRERAEIFAIHIKKAGRDATKFNLRDLVNHSKGFSGAEIEQSIISAMHDSFMENREVASEDIVKSLNATVPLSKTMREKITELRAWAVNRARPVSSLQPTSVAAEGD